MGKAYLEHLDEGDTEVHVCEVTTDERQGEKETNWNNGSEVHSAGHGDLLSGVEDVCEAGHDLGHEGCKGKMPCREENGKAWRIVNWVILRLSEGCNCRHVRN